MIGTQSDHGERRWRRRSSDSASEDDVIAEQRLEAEHGPVARAATGRQAATSMSTREERARRSRWAPCPRRRGRPASATTLASASSGGERGGGHERPRALAGPERLERGADRGVALLGARVAAAHAVRADGASGGRWAPATGRLGAAAPLAAAPTHAGAVRARRAARAPPPRGRRRSAIARTTTIRRAPALTTAPTLPASMPPMANHGTDTCAAAYSIGSTPIAGRPALVGVACTGPDGDVVGAGAAAAPGPAASSASRARRARRRRRACAARSTGMSSWPTCTPSAPRRPRGRGGR